MRVVDQAGPSSADWGLAKDTEEAAFAAGKTHGHDL